MGQPANRKWWRLLRRPAGADDRRNPEGVQRRATDVSEVEGGLDPMRLPMRGVAGFLVAVSILWTHAASCATLDSSLLTAAQEGNAPKIHSLLSRGANPNAANSDGNTLTALMLAARGGHSNAVSPHFSPSPCPRTFRCDQSTQRGRLPWRRVVGAADGRARGALRASSAGSGRILGAPVRPFTRRVGFGGCCGLSAGQQRKAAQARS